MPSTTTAFTACDWVLELDNDLGTLTDVSTSSSKVDTNFDNQVGEFRTFGSQWKSRLVCGKDASFKLTGVASTADGELRDLIETWYFEGSDAPRTFKLSAPGDSVGDVSYTAEVVLKTFKFGGDASSADPVMYDIELLPTGEVVREVIAA
jgi:hypothetical protein